MQVAEKLKDKPGVSLQVPALLPSNGRLILQGVKKSDYKVGNIIIPVNLNAFKDNQDRNRSNPYSGYEFYCVAKAPEVDEQLRLRGHDGKEIRVDIGDIIVLSERMEPITYQEGQSFYFLIHWQDILGVIKNPVSMQ